MAGAVVLAASLAGCALMGTPLLGEVFTGFADSRVAEAYLPLSTREMLVFGRWGAALVVAPHVAVTNAHNANLLPEDSILAQARDYDLLFFRTEKAVLPPTGQARIGAEVIAYGQGRDGSLREARGVVRSLASPVAPLCATCRPQRAIAFDAQAGPGFSGGPLVDAETGIVVGVIFGYRDGEGAGGGRRMFAYDIALVRAEMDRLLAEIAP